MVRFFAQAGVPRAQRSIERFCQLGKLDCHKDPDEGLYYGTRESVEHLIENIKELKARHEPLEISEPSLPASASKRQGATTLQDDTDETIESVGNMNEQGRALRAKVRRLGVEADVNKRYIEKLEEEREKFIDRMITQSHQIGLLEKENEQLQNLIEAPKADHARVVETLGQSKASNERDAEYTEVEMQPTEEIL